MAKEYFWNLRVDGTRHEVLAKDRGNGFDIYVDGEFRFSIRSDINLDIEEDLTVGTKRCRIVVYRGVPDLAVDGILLDAEAALRKQEKRSRLLTILVGLGLVLLGLFAMWMHIAVTVSGVDFYFGAFGPIFALLVSAAGVALTVYGIRKKGI
jgi:hypothetical protein